MKQQISWILPIKTVSEANSVEHWTLKRKRHHTQQWQIREAFLKHSPIVQYPVKIVLTRLSTRLLDDDNLVSAFKWIRDEIAWCLKLHENTDFKYKKSPGRFDNDPLAVWQYRQEIYKPQGIKIEIFY